MPIDEKELARIALCPMFVPGEQSKLELCADTLTTIAIRRAFEGKLLKLEDIRSQFTYLWGCSNFSGTDSKAWCIPPMKAGNPYWVGIHQGRTISFRIFSLVAGYEILHPEQPYNLILNGYTIQGRYALLKKPGRSGIPNVLVTYLNAPSLRHEIAMPPDPISLSRYVDVKMATMYKEVYVLHYPLLKGKEWQNKEINEAVAKRYLSSMLDVVALNPRYPTAGSHCMGCEDKPCMEVFKLDR